MPKVDTGNAFNLEDALTFYGSYHNNRINQIIHVIFVPCIVWTAFVILHYLNINWLLQLFGMKLLSLTHFAILPTLLNPFSYLPHFITLFIEENFQFSAGTLLCAVLCVYYLTLTKGVRTSAITYDIFLCFLVITSGYYYRTTNYAWQSALLLHAFSWYMQIHPGHKIFEQRNAALTDNFFKGVALGPLFAWFEILFWCGWNPTLRARLQKRIDANIATYRASLKKA
jgi:uncharacterized membrane protein YGL010W